MHQGREATHLSIERCVAQLQCKVPGAGTHTGGHESGEGLWSHRLALHLQSSTRGMGIGARYSTYVRHWKGLRLGGPIGRLG